MAQKVSNQNLPALTTLLADEFNHSKYSDLSIVCGSSTWAVHKLVLCTVSPFFRAACEHEMKEKQQSTITLEDIEENIALETIKFLYTGVYPATSEDALTNYRRELLFHVAMYSAADKFFLPTLKNEANKHFDRVFHKSKRDPSFIDAFCDAVKTTEHMVPYQKNDILRHTQSMAARILLELNFNNSSEKIIQLFEDAPEFGVRFATNLVKDSNIWIT